MSPDAQARTFEAMRLMESINKLLEGGATFRKYKSRDFYKGLIEKFAQYRDRTLVSPGGLDWLKNIEGKELRRGRKKASVTK